MRISVQGAITIGALVASLTVLAPGALADTNQPQFRGASDFAAGRPHSGQPQVANPAPPRVRNPTMRGLGDFSSSQGRPPVSAASSAQPEVLARTGTGVASPDVLIGAGIVAGIAVLAAAALMNARRRELTHR